MKTWPGFGRLPAVVWASLLLTLFTPRLRADNVRVLFPEGITRGFLAVADDGGKKIGDGDLQQIVQGDRVTNHLLIRFQDGSSYDDSTVFTQRGVFHLLTDHLVETGPAFSSPMETSIDTSTGRVTVRYKDGHGNDKTLSKHMDLPSDLANGLLYVLPKDMKPDSGEIVVSYLASTPEPRLVKLVFKAEGKDRFATGGVHRDALHYVMRADIGGVTGVVARLLGKQPPNTDMWVIGGDAPTFAGSQGPLDGNGRIWKISLVSPVLADPDSPVKH